MLFTAVYLGFRKNLSFSTALRFTVCRDSTCWARQNAGPARCTMCCESTPISSHQETARCGPPPSRQSFPSAIALPSPPPLIQLELVSPSPIHCLLFSPSRQESHFWTMALGPVAGVGESGDRLVRNQTRVNGADFGRCAVQVGICSGDARFVMTVASSARGRRQMPDWRPAREVAQAANMYPVPPASLSQGG